MEAKEDIPKKAKVTGVKVSFEQDGNTLGTTDKYEDIDVSLEFPGALEEGPFFVIKTEGWSFDDLSELEDLINRAKRVLE